MDYGYINARIRGMKSRLLDQHNYEELMFQPDIDSLILQLEKTPYEDEIVKARGVQSGILCIELALRNDFVKTFQKIADIVHEKEAEKYLGIFLHRWDVHNIKTILRGKNIHATNEEILSCLIPAGELDEATLSELLKQPDPRAVIDLLATFGINYAKPLTQSFKDYTEKGDISILECALDKFYYIDALSSVQSKSYNESLIRALVATEIDIINIRTVLRLVRDRTSWEDAEKYMIEGGRELLQQDLKRLMGLHSTEEIITELGRTRYKFLRELPAETIKMGKISQLEKHLEKYLIQEGAASFMKDPLSVALIVGYFWAKYNEIINIRIISRSKMADLTEEQIKEELVYV